MKTKFIITISLFLIASSLTFAQPGSLDLSFDPGTGANDLINCSVLLPDGKIIITGQFTSFNGIERNRIARLNTDGSLDLSFDPGTGPNNIVTEVSVQNDGKIIVAGNFTSFNGTEINRIARLNANGSLDNTFDPGSGLNSWVFAQTIQNDGKIVIGGIFTSYNGTPRNYIARLNEDGSLDTSFNPGTGPNSGLLSLHFLADGKIMIGGDFSSYNGTARNNIARLNTDGSLDLSFNTGIAANGGISCFSPLDDGKIIVGGSFTSFASALINSIARVNEDGSLDTSFESGIENVFDPYVKITRIQSDGKIIIGGFFSHYSGASRNGIVRVNSDGSLDNSFDPGTGTTNLGAGFPVVNTAHIQSDGKIIIAGEFTAYNGTPRNHIARLLIATPSDVHSLENVHNSISIFPNPLSKTASIQSNVELKNAELLIYNLSGQLVKQISSITITAGDFITLNRDGLPTGLYFAQIIQDNQIFFTDKLVISD